MIPGIEGDAVLFHHAGLQACGHSWQGLDAGRVVVNLSGKAHAFCLHCVLKQMLQKPESFAGMLVAAAELARRQAETTAAWDKQGGRAEKAT